MAKGISAYYKLQTRYHRQYERRAAKIFFKALKEQVRPVLDALEAGAVTDEQLPYLISPEPIRKAYIQSYEFIGALSAEREYKWIKKSEPAKADPDIMITFMRQVWTDFMRNYALTEAADLIKDVTETTIEQVRFALAEAAERNLIGTHVAKLIREHTLGEIGLRRSLVIARTESTRASSAGKAQGAESWAKEVGTRLYKRWLPRLDGHERATHRQAGADLPVLSTEKFKVGNSLMDMPGDPSAPAKETINCRCTVIYMSERKYRRDYLS